MRSRYLVLLCLVLLLFLAVSCDKPHVETPPVTDEASVTTTATTTSSTTKAPVTTVANVTTTVTTTKAPVTTTVTTTAAPTAPLNPKAAGYVMRADGIVIDGVAEQAYYNSVKLSSVYADDPSTVSTKDGFPMYKIYAGSALKELPKPSFTLYALWGEEGEMSERYLYFLIVVKDSTPNTRRGEYMSQGDPWLNDVFELSYHLGGATAPAIPQGDKNTYPTYNNVFVDAREKSVSDHTASTPNHAAVAAQRSYYFDKIESATTRPDDSTYIIEIKIPAYTESYTGTPGPTLLRSGGAPLESGDLIYLCIELLDLTYLPDGYDDKLPSGDKFANEWNYSPQGDWKAFETALYPYVYSAGNRSVSALRKNGPVVFQLQ